MNPYKSVLISAALITVAVPSYAQESEAEDIRLGTITVEGSRLDQTETEIGSSVSVITGEEIEKLGFDFALDVFQIGDDLVLTLDPVFHGLGEAPQGGVLSARRKAEAESGPGETCGGDRRRASGGAA